jgi:hypothetical protein
LRVGAEPVKPPAGENEIGESLVSLSARMRAIPDSDLPHPNRRGEQRFDDAHERHPALRTDSLERDGETVDAPVLLVIVDGRRTENERWQADALALHR